MTQIIIKNIKELHQWKLKNQTNINFVPTMGNLHNGHKVLIREANKATEASTLLSIFINPLQFDDKNDFRNYPQTINEDIDIGFSAGAEAIFIPSVDEIFPKKNNFKLVKAPKDLSNNLCGLYRKGHFDGVCTVVYRLLKLIKPQTIFLGEKDWQQLLIVKEMIKDNNIKITTKSIDTQRDENGVPFSSRNSILSEEDRNKLTFFSKELQNAKITFDQTKKINLKKIIKNLENININIEYLEHVNAFNLKRFVSQENITMLAGAIKCGNTRLIDHVFLMRRNPIIAIDGPAGSGKSTVTKLLAERLSFIYLDTGAMYRALSWYLINEKINYENIEELDKFLKDISIEFKSISNSVQNVFINNHNVTEKIRSQEISNIVSSIASIKQVREFLVKEQRNIGEKGGIIAEGRDIGSIVFPNAELKIFLTASIDERAKRRKFDLENKSFESIDFDRLKEQIKKRDFDDSNRTISPLTKADDAIEIISDGFNANEIVDQIMSIYIETIPKELNMKFKNNL